VIQVVESYLLTPLIERKTVSLPPALTLVALAVAALLFGWLGLLLAAPATAALLVLVQMVYLEDTLGESNAR
jgi:predicted PurR-regulated permease PerM